VAPEDILIPYTEAEEAPLAADKPYMKLVETTFAPVLPIKNNPTILPTKEE